MQNTAKKNIFIVIFTVLSLLLSYGIGFAKNNASSKQADYVDAVELKLKAREIASQLLNTFPNDLLNGLVALPTSFVNLDDFDSSSSFGRYLAEAMFYEFNLRGFATKEYRLNGKIETKAQAGEFALTRDLPPINYNQPYTALLVGTYTKDEAAIYVNARLVRPVDGLVLRVAQIVMPMNDFLDRMSKTPKYQAGTIKITNK